MPRTIKINMNIVCNFIGAFGNPIFNKYHSSFQIFYSLIKTVKDLSKIIIYVSILNS